MRMKDKAVSRLSVRARREHASDSDEAKSRRVLSTAVRAGRLGHHSHSKRLPTPIHPVGPPQCVSDPLAFEPLGLSV